MTSTTARTPLLWRGAQVRIVVLAELIASALMGVAAYQSVHTGSFEEQTDWVTVAIAGLAGAALVSAIWLLRARQRVAARRARLIRTATAAFGKVVGGAETDGVDPVAAESMSHYHRPSCLLVRGKDVGAATRLQHQRAKRTPCAVCRP